MRASRLAVTAAVLLPLSIPAPAQAPATVTVTLTSHRIAPNPIYLRADRKVRLVFLNRAGKTHDFTAPRFFRESRIVAGRAPRGEIALEGGRGAVVDLIPRRGTYKVHCGQFGHKQLGMKGMIVVS